MTPTASPARRSAAGRSRADAEQTPGSGATRTPLPRTQPWAPPPAGPIQTLVRAVLHRRHDLPVRRAVGTELVGDDHPRHRARVLQQAAEEFAPVLATNGGGTILNVLSAMSWLAYDGANAYSAAKVAAWSLTNGIRLELAGQGTTVTGLHLASTDTASRPQGRQPLSTLAPHHGHANTRSTRVERLVRTRTGGGPLPRRRAGATKEYLQWITDGGGNKANTWQYSRSPLSAGEFVSRRAPSRGRTASEEHRRPLWSGRYSARCRW
ncbi:SDR family NAD(P)-dependent oxidoreductase [Actinacidiphila oryziradicis]|uniref:SDR family NAD(P)-dependent oxidoreductase n=1 Tax=Actinacidiphila oryziradicis TaxID=2571141 RepID=A0A4U0S5G8_9ACTN|nr:SDR family NAD(P)-dependent oxidoreductase [Actinacidiphila oryziradicis]